MRTQVKLFREAVTAGDPNLASDQLASAERAIRRAAIKGVIPKRRADRSVSRLAKHLNALRRSG